MAMMVHDFLVAQGYYLIYQTSQGSNMGYRFLRARRQKQVECRIMEFNYILLLIGSTPDRDNAIQ
jgi:hypothetical protein